MSYRAIGSLAGLLVAGAAYSQTIVSTDFESNTLGPLAGQSAGGSYIWDTIGSPFPAVVNTAPTLGSQSVLASFVLGAGLASHHNWVVLGSPGYTIPAGKWLRGSVDVYVDTAQPNAGVGLSVWANDGANFHGVLALASGNRAVMRNGTGTPAPGLYSGVPGVIDNAWNTIAVEVRQIDANTLESSYLINGVSVPAIKHTRTIGTGNLMSDFDLVIYNVDLVAEQLVVGRYDNYRVQLMPMGQSLALKVVLADWTASTNNVPVVVEISDGITTESKTATLDASGNATVTTALSGNLTVRVKASHWLADAEAVTVAEGGSGSGSFTLINGDCDDDNSVTVFDYSLLSDAFDSSPSSSNWDPRADLDGDESVTVFDYSILSDNFDKSGD